MHPHQRGFLHRSAGAFLVVLFLVLTALPTAEARRRKDLPPPPEENPEVFFQEGLLFYNEGQLDRALERFERATELAPAYTEAWYMLGMVHLNLADLDKAEGSLRQALEVNSFFTDAHNLLGMIYDQKGELDRAVTEWNIVLSDKNFPQPWVATFNIGRAMAARQNWEEAVVYFQRTVGLKEDWFRAWWQLGQAQEELGNTGKALEAYEEAMERSEANNPFLYKIEFRLALASYKLGYNARAAEHFRSVQGQRPDTAEGKKAKEFLRLLQGGVDAYQGLPRSLRQP